jgi:hypothetical protein
MKKKQRAKALAQKKKFQEKMKLNSKSRKNKFNKKK